MSFSNTEQDGCLFWQAPISYHQIDTAINRPVDRVERTDTQPEDNKVKHTPK